MYSRVICVLLLSVGLHLTTADDLVIDVDDCGGNFTSPHGKFNSPTWVKPDMTCTWDLESKSANGVVYIVFNTFLLQEGDLFTVNGTNETDVMIFAGRRERFLLIVDVKSKLIFKTSATPGDRSFSGTYDYANCENTWTDEHGTFAAPIYTRAVNASVKCTWILRVLNKPPTDYTLALSFNTFNLTSESRMIISDGIQRSSPVIGNFTGSLLPPDLISSNESLKIELTMNLSSSNVEFRAEYKPITKGCSQTLNVNNTYSLVPPEYDPSASSVKCVWIIKGPENTTFMGRFQALALTNLRDSVIINDGSRRFSPNLHVVTYENHNLADLQIMTKGNDLWVEFTREQFLPNSTFNLALISNVLEGIYKDSGNFDVPEKSGHGSETVRFMLEVPLDKQVEVTIESSSIGPNNAITFYDGNMTVKPNLATFKSGTPLYPVFSISSTMLVLASNFSGSDYFNASFRSVPMGCNSISEGNSGLYRLLWKDIIDDCAWLIRPFPHQKNGVIAVSLNTLNFLGGSTLSVYKGMAKEPNNLIASYNISNVVVPVYVPVDTGVRLQVTSPVNSSDGSNGTTTAVGAFYEILPDCSETIELTSDEETQINTPNYPLPYPINANCRWMLHNPKNQTLRLGFGKGVDLLPNHFLRIATASAPNATMVQLDVITNDSIPNDLILNAYAVELNFTSVSQSSQSVHRLTSGFQIVAQVLDCGGNMTELGGSFTTVSSNNSIECIWIISLPPKTKDLVNIVQFNYKLVKDWGTNNGSTLEFHDGGSLSSAVMNAGNASQNYLSRTNFLLVRYQSTNSSNSPVFNVSYSTHGCDKEHLCQNGICLHDDWRCNGHNDCGDLSDELNCVPAPSAPAGPVSYGVPVVWVVVTSFLVFLTAIALTLVVPPAWRRVRIARQRYQDFHNLPEA